MRIAFVCTEKLPVPPVSGGAIQIYIEGVLPYLSKHHDITVLSIKKDSLPDEEVVGNVRYKRLMGRTKSEYLKNLRDNISNEYHLVHVFNRPLWVMPLNQQAPGSAFSLSLHNEMFLPNKIDRERALKCITTVKFITTVSRFIADGVKDLYPIAEEKLNVVYSGVNPTLYKPICSRIHLRRERRCVRNTAWTNIRLSCSWARPARKRGPTYLSKR